MNKREKEILQAQLDSEKAVLKEIEKQYEQALRDINDRIRLIVSDDLTQSKIYQLNYQKALRAQVKGILEKLHSDEYATIQQFLNHTYTDAFVGAAYNLAGQGIPLMLPINQASAVKAIMTDSKISKGLYDSLGVDVNGLKKSISAEITRGIASGMPLEDIARNISNTTKAPYSRAKSIVYTEGHRVQQASTFDAQQAAKSKGADVVKMWDAALDGRTRETHRELDGQIREVDEPFEANGRKAMFPGDFGDPAEDCNCRCVSLTRAKWALDETELQTMKDRAEYFGLDKTEDFEDFKGKYLNGMATVEAAEQADNPVKNKFGDTIIFDERLNAEKWAESVGYIKELTEEYDTRLTAVGVGSVGGAGSVNMGGLMKLSSAKPEVAFHEFAHSVAIEELTKYGVTDDSAFWKEIKAVKRAYMKDVADDSSRWISSYEHGSRDVNEFFAEAFTHAKMLEKGIDIPVTYGKDATYSNKVLEIVDKYFKKPLENTTKSGKMSMGSSVVKDAVSSGKVSTTVNSDKQNRHIKGSAGYIEGRSYIFGGVDDAQKLIDELSGTGVTVMAKGKWQSKERVTSANTIGVHINPKTKAETETKSGMIIYSKTGSHIVPRKGDEE